MQDIYKNKRREYVEDMQGQPTLGEMIMLIVAVLAIAFMCVVFYSALHIQ